MAPSERYFVPTDSSPLSISFPPSLSLPLLYLFPSLSSLSLFDRRSMEKGGGEREEADYGGGSSAYGGVGPRAVAAAPERHVMRWESFLPRRSMRVLLVEGDDSTRHIVTALLRKCNYRVAGVADGMKAWEVMKEKRYSFDLVLTEVAVPSLSGIGLLTKIMSAEEYKNIPVIMMSTHDSVNVVLKCMLKGAVDFLVKPVRKNELQNLWQHVWRRHCSDRYINAPDNNTASNQISVNIGGRSKTGENSDERSDAQSSGSKRDTEIESTQKHEEPLHVDDRRISEGEANLDSLEKDTVIRESQSNMDDVRNTRDYKTVGVRIDVTSPIQEISGANATQGQDQPYNISSYREGNLELVRRSEDNKDDPKSCCQNNAPNESVQNLIVFVEPVSNGQCSYDVLKTDALVEDGLCKTAKYSFANDASYIDTSPLWELSLRRPQPNGCVQAELKEKHALKHSVASAFSRYGEKRIHSSFQKSVSSDLCIRARDDVEKCHSFGSSHGTDNKKVAHFSHIEKTLSSTDGNEGETAVYFQDSSTNKEKASLSSQPIENGRAVHSSTVEDTVLQRPQYGFIQVPIPVGAMPYQSLCAGYGGILQPVFYPETSLAPQASTTVEKPPATQFPSDHPVHHNHHLIDRSSSLDFHYHEESDHPHHWRRTIDISEPGESRELCNHLDQAYQNDSCSQDVLKGSGSNGSGETADGARNRGNALESGNERKVSDCDHSRREAALIKFRLKRKDRCFEKKVRYHSRKKLAEQRPRIKGQFVRQKIPESTKTGEGDN